MSEITKSPRSVDLRQTRAVSGLVLRSIVAGTKTTARIAWAVLKSLGELALILALAAVGVVAIRYAAQTLLSDDATILRHIAHSAAPNPFALPGTVDNERSEALFGFGTGMVIATASCAGVVIWCGQVWNALFNREQADTAK